LVREPALSLAVAGFGEKSRLRALLDHFSAIADRPEPWRVAHPLPEVLLLVVCATIADCDDYDRSGGLRGRQPLSDRHFPPSTSAAGLTAVHVARINLLGSA
jgi:hypothetical protein